LVSAAARGDTSKVIASLNKDTDVNAKASRDGSGLAGQTALMAAAGNGHAGTVRALLDRGADVNVKHEVGGTALTGAAAAGRLEVVKALLGAGADPNVIVATFHGGAYTALMIAMNPTNRHWLGIMDAMIAAGAEVNPQSGFYLSPLRYAIENDDTPMIEAALKRGADVNLRDQESGETPLMFAARYSTPEVVKALIGAGAEVNARNKEGRTALAIAEEGKDNLWRNEIVELLKWIGAKQSN
jgi:ankyrin repeat protein